jgi:geranylgeranyl diphosphate synthase type II
MDDAPLRRGMPTVHEKYDLNTGILSGDVMIIWAYKLLNDNYSSEVSHQLIKVFTQMSIEVCEGQQMDINFETSNSVSIDDYLQMITYKTAVLIATAMKMGAIVGGADEKAQNHLYQYGKNIGIAFQIQDDILDVYGEHEIGKQKAGDIINNKKTYLYLKSLELGDKEEIATLEKLFKQKEETDDEQHIKIGEVLKIFNNTHVKGYATQLMEGYRDLAFSHLDSSDISDKYKSAFKMLGNYILERKF